VSAKTSDFQAWSLSAEKTGLQVVRAFIAIPLPHELCTSLSKLQERLQSGLPKEAVRWASSGQIHLTLKFLGDVASAELTEMEKSLEEICRRFSPFSLRAEGLGCFPSVARPRVVWVGLRGDMEALQRLQSQIDPVLRPWCEGNEERAFLPHLTIGRVRETGPRMARQVGARVLGSSPPRLGEWNVQEVKLVQSKLSPKGAKHSYLASLRLVGER
jgi:2'-5' RNA ligase